MGKWRLLRIGIEIALIIMPTILGGIFLFFDLIGFAQLGPGGRHLNWVYLSLIAFGAVIIVALIDIGRLVRRVFQLEGMQAELSVVFRDEHPYFWPQWGYRIGVYNHGPAAAQNVEVMLQDIVPQPQTYLELNILPSPLGHKGGYCQATHCVINAHTEHYYDVVRDVSPRPMGGLVWGLQTKEHTDTWLAINEEKSCYFVLVVSASNAREKLTRYLRLHQKKDGGLAITLLEQVPDMPDSPTPTLP
jgi:hypothetical protein